MRNLLTIAHTLPINITISNNFRLEPFLLEKINITKNFPNSFPTFNISVVIKPELQGIGSLERRVTYNT